MVIINRLCLPTTKLLFFRKFSTEIVNKSENYTKLGHSVNLFNKELASFRKEMNLMFNSTSRKMEHDFFIVTTQIETAICSNTRKIITELYKIKNEPYSAKSEVEMIKFALIINLIFRAYVLFVLSLQPIFD
ncbi:hypothetical protein ACQ4LE_008110 [Meloidogyne hapla]|uniref:Uncharacterized protein n=1 Tax=Meloidogyne hapla TaxID=6305 RepID=A0A1I8B2H6_MELHA